MYIYMCVPQWARAEENIYMCVYIYIYTYIHVCLMTPAAIHRRHPLNDRCLEA